MIKLTKANVKINDAIADCNKNNKVVRGLLDNILEEIKTAEDNIKKINDEITDLIVDSCGKFESLAGLDLLETEIIFIICDDEVINQSYNYQQAVQWLLGFKEGKGVEPKLATTVRENAFLVSFNLPEYMQMFDGDHLTKMNHEYWMEKDKNGFSKLKTKEIAFAPFERVLNEEIEMELECSVCYNPIFSTRIRRCERCGCLIDWNFRQEEDNE